MTKAKAPSVGDFVEIVVDPRQNNGSDTAPAVVTRVTEEDEATTLNLQVLLDAPEILWLRDVPYHSSRPDEGNERVAFKKA